MRALALRGAERRLDRQRRPAAFADRLVAYHWFVRYTWAGAVLSGRRHPRTGTSPPQGTVAAPG
ncbi:MAG: hypothetical protein JXB36_14890 [Gammaproteobacteria bacterium]|nr:hypothetical protein [Gammaproteobacteria bacterium]